MTVIETTYKDLLQREEWKRFRLTVIQRDGHACQNCGADQKLQVHHRQYHKCKRTGRKLAPWCYDTRYLVTLCERCHLAGHSSFRVPQFTI